MTKWQPCNSNFGIPWSQTLWFSDIFESNKCGLQKYNQKHWTWQITLTIEITNKRIQGYLSFFILSNKNSQIHKNHKQSMLFNHPFLTLYGCNRKTHVLRIFRYLTFNILTTGHEMAIISVTLVCKTISEISFVSLCYVPYFEGLLLN